MLGRVIVVGNGRPFAGDANDRARRMIGIGFDVGDVLAQLRLDEDWKRLDRLFLGLNEIGSVPKDQAVFGEDELRLAFAEGLAVYEFIVSGSGKDTARQSPRAWLSRRRR